jgi:hypothetical protein
MVSKAVIIGNIVAIGITIAGIASSAYGVGKNESNKETAEYAASSQFLTISIILCIIFIISLFIMVLMESGAATVTLNRTGGLIARPTIY